MIVDDSSVDNPERPDYDPEYLLLENVSTFLIMPTDIEVMVFFTTNEFCIINYFTKNCGRRSTRDLFGCDDDHESDDNNNGMNSNRPHNITVVNIMANDRSFNEPSNNSNTESSNMTTAKILSETIKESTSNEMNAKMSTSENISIVKNISTTDTIVNFVSTKMPTFLFKNDDNGTQPNETNLSETTVKPSITTDDSIVEPHEKRNKQDEIEQIIKTTKSSKLLCHTATTISNNNNISEKTSNIPIHNIVTSNYDDDNDVDTATNSNITMENHLVNNSLHHSKQNNDENGEMFSEEITCDIDCVILKLKQMENYDQKKRGTTMISDYPPNDYNVKSIITILIRSDIIHGHFLKNGSFIIGRIIFRG
ncbi:hypothetical protein BLA29_006416 [Euroglyphus maynei]|uniref:Uncharacterized protein n=1 Tax=Euroglyphus maynei TaxID=6958 RepID=A0A1Y3B4U6_EURMA|nr:hypothetical protein BLA29_006416 [Euroglyphus maynei]